MKSFCLSPALPRPSVFPSTAPAFILLNRNNSNSNNKNIVIINLEKIEYTCVRMISSDREEP